MQCILPTMITIVHHSEAEWHKNAGEYGKNYDPDLQLWRCMQRAESAGGATGSDMARTISAEDLAKVRKSLSELQSACWFLTKTQISGDSSMQLRWTKMTMGLVLSCNLLRPNQ